ncbi:MAG: 30S ribosomal protein S7 [Candidatus Omnitrophica bacterium]|nr:30S ribosomal protein S7 [Candidatus Omnitrophota bacterium]
MRRRRASKRTVSPDAKYGSNLVQKMINIVMERGKKSLAERIVYNAFGIAAEKLGKDSLEVFKQAIDNVRPLLETKSRRVGGATYQVPVSVRMDRGQSLAIRWIKRAARSKKGAPMEQKLAGELIDAYNKAGSAMKKREDTHKMAESNRAFAHYRW